MAIRNLGIKIFVLLGFSKIPPQRFSPALEWFTGRLLMSKKKVGAGTSRRKIEITGTRGARVPLSIHQIVSKQSSRRRGPDSRGSRVAAKNQVYIIPVTSMHHRVVIHSAKIKWTYQRIFITSVCWIKKIYLCVIDARSTYFSFGWEHIPFHWKILMSKIDAVYRIFGNFHRWQAIFNNFFFNNRKFFVGVQIHKYFIDDQLSWYLLMLSSGHLKNLFLTPLLSK